VTSSVNNTLVEAFDGSARASAISTSRIGKKDFPNGREGISKVPILWRLPLLLGHLAQAFISAVPHQISSIANLLINIDGIAHASRCPMLEDNVGVHIHYVLNDLFRSQSLWDSTMGASIIWSVWT
jgi:hypothetical protein